MSLVGNVVDAAGVTWGKYADESDPNSFFYVNVSAHEPRRFREGLIRPRRDSSTHRPGAPL